MFGCFVFYFKGIINGFAKEDGLAHTQDNNREELRTDAEQNVSRFIEVAKQLETFFFAETNAAFCSQTRTACQRGFL